MASVSVTIPAEGVAAIKEALGDDATGLTDKAAAVEWMKRTLRPTLQAAERRKAATATAIADAEADLLAKEAAAAAAIQARKDAEATADATAETQLAGVK